MLNASSQSIIKASIPFSLPEPLVGGNNQTHAYLKNSSVGPSLSAFSSRKHGLLVGGYVSTTTRARRARTGVRASAVVTTNNKAATVEIATNNKASPAITPTLPLTKVTATIIVMLSDSTSGASNQDPLGQTLYLELIGAELDPKAHSEKIIKGYASRRVKEEDGKVTYEAKFAVPTSFGEVGAVLTNNYSNEMYLEEIVLQGFTTGAVHFNCNSWVQPNDKRTFFTNKSYLPSQTPSGLKQRRQRELDNLRGHGTGERKPSDRIYDYDTYNDLGDPDSNPDLKRLSWGVKPILTLDVAELDVVHLIQIHYQRKEQKTFLPRDEQFSEVKEKGFQAKSLLTVLRSLPLLHRAIDSLFDVGLIVPGLDNIVTHLLPERLIKIKDKIENAFLRFERPDLFKRDRFAWSSDEEFARQTLAGLNPLSIKLVKEWPLRSELDEHTYGPAESAITAELIEREMKGSMNVEQAIEKKRLFILDYHDAFLPYANRVREEEGTALYGSRTLFFLADDGMLRPLAIELTRPPYDGKPQWKQVFTPSGDSTSSWLWRFAKAHVLAHDAGYQQLISHWLVKDTLLHGTIYNCSESPIECDASDLPVNANARKQLINAGGIIETTFSPGKYCMEISSVVYDAAWHFDLEALPADLISRGMAVEDPSKPHGLELTIKDYPYASDGLILWDAIEQWVEDYVNHYYPEASLVKSDSELQAWWEEVRTVGHGDKKDEPWWPILGIPEDLVQTLTTIIWVASGHHAAVNFGQYPYAGYFPNRPTIARTKMPSENPTDDEWELFLENPESVLLHCFPSQIQATKVMATLDLLSTHSIDEEYLGQKLHPAWEKEAAIKAAFKKFAGRLMELEGTIDTRNNNYHLKNRNGAGVLPYELLKPTSEPGVTAKGVPNSISI
ncbi:LOW QUALITY PROTEIN: hypothetical protein Cgig2_000478 [Carnegiea gigantea]|uniref:Lipoxygenase n=1 Tax=Carnegiea gigantea TaxID=171969 RepID=A0A9Q1K491_9CARY|nr:LOW QUALITY PROTEIN: hypothetical protein Cgig2_000478 [Carnegiea gigantea]